MAKVSRDMLKDLVKECLFEILLESTGDTGTRLVEAQTRPRPVAKSKKAGLKNRKTRPALDAISFGKKSEKNTKPPAPRSIDVSGITADPVMASIFQDTAATTLLEQNAAESGRPGCTTRAGGLS